MSDKKANKKQQARLLKLLLKAGNVGVCVEICGSSLVASYRGKDFSFPKEVYIDALEKQAVLINGKQISISDIGKVIARKLLHPELEFLNPQQDRVDVSHLNTNDKTNGDGVYGTKNLSESPLTRLYSRKGKDGKAYINSEELAAGEKLRTDFERANLQPSITASWDGIAMGKSGSGGGNHHADISDFAIDSRKYVENAIKSLGPELSGIALDVCCFLKGLELVEHERRWPPRSAKLMLKTALSILARHYGYSRSNGRRQGKIEHWGGDRYRPEIRVRD